MYYVDMNNKQLLLRFSDVFGGPLLEIPSELSSMSLDKTISIICELIKLRQKGTDINVLGFSCRIPFEIQLKRLIGIDAATPAKMLATEELHKDRHIISLQCLLILLKYAIIYCKKTTDIPDEDPVTLDDYSTVIKLNMVVAEHLDKHIETAKDMSHFVYANYHVNYDRNVANAFLRSYFMFEEISRNVANFDADVRNEYRDYYCDFTTKYGYTPFQYLSCLFWQLQPYYSKEVGLAYDRTWSDLNLSYGKTPMLTVCSKIIDDLSKNATELAEWAAGTIDKPWDFSEFSVSPFLRNEANHYISISDYTLKNCFFEKLFWLVRDCYPKSDSRCMAFYGRLFEKYVQRLIERAISSNGELEFIDEFVFKNKKSSDAYIKHRKMLLVIEAKGYSILIDTLTKNEQIERNLNKLFVEPVIQADRFLDTLGNSDQRFIDIEEIYYVSVTMDNINAVPDYLKTAIDAINNSCKMPQTKYTFNLGIEELEMLMYFVEQKYDVFDLLKTYYRTSALKPFSTYLKGCDANVVMTSFMKDVYDKACDAMQKLYREDNR